MTAFYRGKLLSVRWILRKGVPPIRRLLLVESGPRKDTEQLIRTLRSTICGDAPIDLFTCLPDDPIGLGADYRAWRSFEAGNHSERWKMLLGLRQERHTAAAIVCSNSPLLAGWKIVLAALLPAKILLIDGRDGFFWLDRAHWRETLRLGISRSGIRSPEFLRRALHAAILPFQLCLLLGFAAKVHLARLVRSAAPDDRSDAPD